ncbi:hypothetical protein FACS189426_22220 [Bacteroidia bacterium]|nr:hypothetical protein FACS189426_22220 [Bacteroidia bacterium]
MSENILIIEDEAERFVATIDKLKESYNVTIARSIEAANNFFDLKKSVDLIVLDVMMSYRGYESEKTDYGMETGWVYYNEKLKEMKEAKILVWTNNLSIFNKPWGENVVAKIPKSTEIGHLSKIVGKILLKYNIK